MDVELKGCPWCGRAAKIRPDGELYVLTVNHSENCILHASESIYTPRNEERRALLVKDWNHRHSGGDADRSAELTAAWMAGAESVRDRAAEDSARLDYIERTFSGMTNRERYLPVTMIWGKGANGRTLREACDKYMAKDAARAGERG